MFISWEHKGNELRKKAGSFTVKISSHALQRIEERKGSKNVFAFKEAAFANAHTFGEIKGIKGMKKGDRFAIRSKEENIVLIMGIGNVYSETDYVLCVCTVWNNEKGTFYFRKGMPVYDFELTKEGPMFSLADEHSISRQNKYIFE